MVIQIWITLMVARKTNLLRETIFREGDWLRRPPGHRGLSYPGSGYHHFSSQGGGGVCDKVCGSSWIFTI